MGGPGSGRKKARPAARCLEHPGSAIVAAGTYKTASGTRRRFRCSPLAGDVHWFVVQIDVDGEPELEHSQQFQARWSPMPKCPEHPDAYVVRNGTYGSHTPKPRQRYRCYPNEFNRNSHHSFTPPLPRDHVCAGDEHCAHCEELRGIHRGETAVARRHSWPTRIVVRGLEQLAGGATYSDVSRWALRVTNSTRTKTYAHGDEASEGTQKATKKRKKKRSAASEASRNSWHVAADWVEAFAPPIWADVDDKLRTRTVAERRRLDELLAAGKPLDMPQVVLVDDVPVYGRDATSGKARRDGGFYILAVAEVFWEQPSDPFMAVATTTKLRLLRAMAKSNTAAWRLVFDELGYTPDFVVADAGTGIAAAFDAHFGPERTRFVPSLWHLARNVEKSFSDTPKAFSTAGGTKRLIAPIDEHMRQLTRDTALATAETWSAWWDELGTLLGVHGLPVERSLERRSDYEQQFADLLDAIHTHPGLPISTGGLETLITKHVHPILAMRRTGFANIERTNLLLDLVVAKHHGAFDEPGDIVELIRTDNNLHGGWTVPLRTIADPRAISGTGYSSLRDATLIATLAEQRGLT